MKKYCAYPILPLLSGLGGFALRFMQNRTGFEAGTGLAVEGALFARLLPAVLAAAALLFLLMARKLPANRSDELRAVSAFSAGIGASTLLTGGAFLWLASGGYGIYSGLTITFSRLDLLVGVMTVLSAIAIFPAIAACRSVRQDKGGFSSEVGNLLLAPVIFLVLMLVLTYRSTSVNPVLQAYYPPILALVCLIMAYFHTAAFAFDDGRCRSFAFWSMAAVAFSLTCLADCLHTPGELLLYAGGALMQLGFLWAQLTAVAPASRA